MNCNEEKTRMNRMRIARRILWVTALAAAWIGVDATAQTAGAQTAPAQAAPGKTTPQDAAQPSAPSPLDQLAWLRGCWAGKVERFDFVENWLPPRGGMMVGINQTVVRERKSNATKTQEFQYLRIEERADGVYYVAIPSGKKESAFKLTSVGEELGRQAYTFTNKSDEFPQQIVYMHGREGSLYAKVSGKTANQPHPTEVTYPMQHVDCTTGAPLGQ
jgi:hypothetical protein